MSETGENDLSGTIGADHSRADLLKEIIGKVDGLDATAADDDLDLWWGTVEVDRLASGLTLAAINKLSEAAEEEDPTGPWLEKSDPAGDHATQLTSDGREALRRIGSV